jgi:hypothetical protein
VVDDADVVECLNSGEAKFSLDKLEPTSARSVSRINKFGILHITIKRNGIRANLKMF